MRYASNFITWAWTLTTLPVAINHYDTSMQHDRFPAMFVCGFDSPKSLRDLFQRNYPESPTMLNILKVFYIKVREFTKCKLCCEICDKKVIE